MAQINPVVGAVRINCDKIIQIIKDNQSTHEMIIFPELTLTGYPPEDLLYHKELHQAVNESLIAIQESTANCHVIVGHPTSISNSKRSYNSLSIFYQGQKVTEYHKQNLPNYAIFDEARYFVSGPKTPCILNIHGHRLGICICEDLWQPGPVEALIAEQVSTVISINASPFDYKKYTRREQLLKHYAQQGIHILYVNQVGAQDELLFDGQSLALDSKGTVKVRSQAFVEELTSLELTPQGPVGPIASLLSTEAQIYEALVCATRDYVQKNYFPGVLLGLSGGVDSALTLAIATDALGPEKVHAVLMPSRYTAEMSNEDALTQIKALQVSHSILPIEPITHTIHETLAPLFTGQSLGTTEENIQARTRGLLLMALSNQTGKMVLTTSNKSEAAVGYATLYGDMAGGYAVLKDVFKTQVYALAKYRNSISPIIPERVLTRAPSAELRENQTDQDSLPDYTTLDAILVAYIEYKNSQQEIVAQGFAAETVEKVLTLIQRNEYKRRQSPPGIKISPLAFGKDWRYPITNQWSQK